MTNMKMPKGSGGDDGNPIAFLLVVVVITALATATAGVVWHLFW